MKKIVFVLVVVSLVSLVALAWVKYGTRPQTPPTVFLTTGECKQLGGNASSDDTCGIGKHICKTTTIASTGVVTTHKLCCSD